MEQKKQGRVFSFGYARVSRKEQCLDRQYTALKKYKPELEDVNIYRDEATGKEFDRKGYIALKAIINQYMGIINSEDTIEVIVEELDRLGRNYEGIKQELQWFKDNGVVLRILEIPTTLVEVDESNRWVMDLITSILIEVYASMAEQELHKRAKRQAEGIAEAKKKGIKFGRKPLEIDTPLFNTVASRAFRKEITHKEAMELLGLKNNTYWKHFNLLFPEYEKHK